MMRSRSRASWGAAFIVLMLAQAASGQEPSRQPENEAAAQTRPAEPGFLHALSRWFDASLANIGLKDTRGSINDLGDRAGAAAKDAAETVVRLPATRVVSSRQKCELAANGAPDCQAAATAMCKNKGFGSGRSVDIESARKCPAHVWLSRRAPAEGECALETFVTRAICQ